MRRTTVFVLHHRRTVLLVWIVLLVAGAAGASRVGSLLSNQFSVPGSASQNGLTLLHDRFHERSDGAFTLVAQAPTGARIELAAVEAAAQRGARALANGKAGPVLLASPTVAYVEIDTTLQNAQASDRTPAARHAIGRIAGARLYLTGFPAINHDTTPLYSQDLAHGEEIALPIAIIVLAFMFATLGGIVVPLLFALFTIPITLGLVWIAAHLITMATYVTNVVTLIGIAIAIDYSMLVVFRYREELARIDDPREALLRTMEMAGRATIFSGLTVAVGLALLCLMPLPFIRSMGIGGLLIPLVSIAASATLLPALLSLMGRGVNRFSILPAKLMARRTTAEGGFWASLARTIMRYPIPVLIASSAVMLALAYPALQLKVTAGDNRGYPAGTEATNGLFILERRLVAELRADPAVNPETIAAPLLAASVAQAKADNLLDPAAEIAQIRVAQHQDSGTEQAMNLVHRIRQRYIPEAGFGSARVYVTGAPAFGVDFIAKAYGAFPWLVAAVLVISYLVLLRAFRSIVLPIKAVLMNLLSVAASYGVLVLFFERGAGHTLLGFKTSPQIDGWIPIFLFAVVFGLSMDYEVFLLSRMREEWDARHDNEHAVAYGLEHTGRIITAAAIIMIAAFSGFTTGRFVGFQEFGTGLSAAILLDATIVRALLVPATMKLLGRWNWYLPEGVRRAMRVTAATTPTRL